MSCRRSLHATAAALYASSVQALSSENWYSRQLLLRHVKLRTTRIASARLHAEIDVVDWVQDEVEYRILFRLIVIKFTEQPQRHRLICSPGQTVQEIYQLLEYLPPSSALFHSRSSVSGGQPHMTRWEHQHCCVLWQRSPQLLPSRVLMVNVGFWVQIFPLQL